MVMKKYYGKYKQHPPQKVKAYHQYLQSNPLVDVKFKAEKPGWRKSKKTGDWYFERRKNRCDIRSGI